MVVVSAVAAEKELLIHAGGDVNSRPAGSALTTEAEKAESWLGIGSAVSDGTGKAGEPALPAGAIRSLSGEEASGDPLEVHLSPSAVPGWFRDLPSMHVAAGVPAALAANIVDDLARQPLSQYRGRRPLSPLERLGISLVELSEAFEQMVEPKDGDDIWRRMLRGERATRMVEPRTGLFRSPAAAVVFTGAPGEIHPQIAVQRIVSPGGSDPEVMLLAEVDVVLGVSVDQVFGSRATRSSRHVWARRYQIEKALALRFRSTSESASRLDIPLVTETAWGVDVSGGDPLPHLDSQAALAPPRSVRVVTGEFRGERLQVGDHVVKPHLLARVLIELGTSIEAVALATRAASPSAALGYARALAELLDVPVVAADGSCHIEQDGAVTAVRRQVEGAASSLARWYATGPGGSVPRRLGRHSLGAALQQL